MSKNNFYPTVPPITHLGDENEIIPLSGLSNVDTVTANENGYWGVYKSDEYGFNNISNQHTKILNTDNKIVFLTQKSAIFKQKCYFSLFFIKNNSFQIVFS